MKTLHARKERLEQEGLSQSCFARDSSGGVVPALTREARADVKKLRFTLACSPYDRLQALIDGSVQVEGVDLNFLADDSRRDLLGVS